MSELHIEIISKLELGITPNKISEQLNIPIEWVLYVETTIY